MSFLRSFYFLIKPLPLVLFFIVCVGVILFSNFDNAFNSKAEAFIVKPKDGSQVSMMIANVSGKIKNLPKTQHLWIYVYAPKDGTLDEGKYYLQEVNYKVKDGNMWTKKHIKVGGDKDKGEDFNLGTLIVNTEIHEQLKLNSQELSKLPDGKSTEISIHRI